MQKRDFAGRAGRYSLPNHLRKLHLPAESSSAAAVRNTSERELPMNTQPTPSHLGPAKSAGRELAEELVSSIPRRPVSKWLDGEFSIARRAGWGLVFGGLAGCTSLLFNIVGSVLWPAISDHAQHPLRLIQVYLTFPLGQTALYQETGVLLTLGCLLYLCTGMLYGAVIQLVVSALIPRAGLGMRMLLCSVLSLGIWLVNFYGVLSWLQPLLLGGRWILDLVPWWVAALTHLVFGWTMALLYPLGTPAHLRNDSSGEPALS